MLPLTMLCAVYNNMGALLQELGRTSDALDAHRASTVLRPDFAEGYANLGRQLQAGHQKRNAIEWARYCAVTILLLVLAF